MAELKTTLNSVRLVRSPKVQFCIIDILARSVIQLAPSAMPLTSRPL